MTGVELLQNGIGRTLGFLGRAGAMISITLLSRAEDEPEYQIHIDTGVSILLNGVAYTSSAEINDDMPYGVCEFDQKRRLCWHPETHSGWKGFPMTRRICCM